MLETSENKPINSSLFNIKELIFTFPFDPDKFESIIEKLPFFIEFLTQRKMKTHNNKKLGCDPKKVNLNNRI